MHQAFVDGRSRTTRQRSRFLPGNGADVGDIVVTHPEMSGLHFTGSTGTFQHLWKKIGENISNHYIQGVGETEKRFIVAHPSTDVVGWVLQILRGAFGFQGQVFGCQSYVYSNPCGLECENIWKEV